MNLSSFSLNGYRSFQNKVNLEQLGSVVILYGLNNAGKTNLLRALTLFTSLIQEPLTRLVDETPRNPEAVYKNFNEDPWMFSLEAGTNAEILLEGFFSADTHIISVGFRDS